jgi:hypothetical protein
MESGLEYPYVREVIFFRNHLYYWTFIDISMQEDYQNITKKEVLNLRKKKFFKLILCMCEPLLTSLNSNTIICKEELPKSNVQQQTISQFPAPS